MSDTSLNRLENCTSGNPISAVYVFADHKLSSHEDVGGAAQTSRTKTNQPDLFLRQEYLGWDQGFYANI